MVREEQLIKPIEEHLSWLILVGIDLVEDDILLFGNFLVWVCGVLDHIHQQFHRPAVMGF